MFTTRNPREAESFVDQLNVSDKFKQLIRDSFEVTTKVHDKIKEHYSSNSKGAEKIFIAQMQSYFPIHLNKLVNEVMVVNAENLGIDQGEVEAACMMEAQMLALLQIGEEAHLSEDDLDELRNYCGICEVALIESFKVNEDEEDDFDGLK